MGVIRKYAAELGMKVVGKLTRMPEFEYREGGYTSERTRICRKAYVDEANNEYYIYNDGICGIVAAENTIH